MPKGGSPLRLRTCSGRKKTRVTYSCVSFGSTSRIGAAPTQKKSFSPLERRVAIRRAILPLPPSPPGNPLMPTHSLAGRTSVKTERGTVHTHTVVHRDFWKQLFSPSFLPCKPLLFAFCVFPKERTVAVIERSRNIFSREIRHSEHRTNRKTYFLASWQATARFRFFPFLHRQVLVCTKQEKPERKRGNACGDILRLFLLPLFT